MKTKYNSTLSTVESNGGDQTPNSIRRKWSALALGGFLFTSMLALSAPPVEAQCQQWDVSGKWEFRQGSGQGANYVIVDLVQNGRSVITGAAVHKPVTDDITHGTVDGTIEGDSFAVKIYWDNNTIGVYEGTIRPSGRIEGKGWEQRSRRVKVNWYSKTVMKCADAAAVQPTKPAPPPLKSTGKVPANPTPPPLKSTGKSKAIAPFIKANPIGVTIPAGQSQGTTTLTWDGGPDHPDAEVWMRVGGAEETLVVQQGKGTRSMTVEAGNVYGFILKDAGQQLTRAAVIAKR